MVSKLKRSVVALVLGIFFLCSLVISLASCEKKDDYVAKIGSDTLYVNKVKNLRDDFILGMDASSVISLEQAGVKYYNFEGQEADVFQTMSDAGLNYIRVRVWNDPYNSQGKGYGGGNNDITKAVAIGKRATAAGMKLLVDFHYSDFWADPAKQQAPKAWVGMSIDNKSTALYDYTKASLQLLKDNGVDVGMVQVGNETNGGKMAGETTWANFAKLANAGSRAIREIFPDALVGVHFTNPEKKDNMLDYAKKLSDNTVDYDVFISSYYPYWHGTLDNLAEVLSTIAKTYNKKVMVGETSYCYTADNFDGWGNTSGSNGSDVMDYPTTIAGQTNHVRNVVNTIKNKTKNGIGVFYWEGTWIATNGACPSDANWDTWYQSNQAEWEEYGTGWAASYAGGYDPVDAGQWYGGCAVENQAFFDSTGHPLESLKVWGLLRSGNKTKLYVDGVEEVSETHYTNENVKLPSKVNAIYNNNSRKKVAVTWENFDMDTALAKGNGKYEIKGKVGDFTTVCHLTLLEANFVENYSFENEDVKPWVVNVTGKTSETYKVQVTQENPQTGGKSAFHFWAQSANTVKFSVEQTLKVSRSGKYKMQFSLLGGASSNPANASLQNIYGYVKINGEIKYTVDAKFTNYDAGYKDFKIENIDYKAGDTIVIGVYVEANEGNSWGDIDDIMFNQQ